MEKHTIQPPMRIQEVDQKTQEAIRLMYALCEEQIKAAQGHLTPAHTALADSALTMQHAVAAFLAVARMIE